MNSAFAEDLRLKGNAFYWTARVYPGKMHSGTVRVLKRNAK